MVRQLWGTNLIFKAKMISMGTIMYKESKWVCSECGDFIYRQCMNIRCKDGIMNQVNIGLTKEESKELRRIKEGE